MKRFFTFTDLMAMLAVFCILGLLCTIFLGARHHHRPAYQKRCTNNLKQIGNAMIMYFSDGTETHMPHNGLDKYIKKTGDMARLFELDADVLSCPAKRNEPQYKSVYVTQRGIEGASFEDIENPSSRIVMDGDELGRPQVHSTGLKMNILFGDGHVENGTP